jgi:hypothetical protein
VNSIKSALLGSSVLTTVGFGASATTFFENSTAPIIPDFSNALAGANPIDFSMFQTVQGTLNGGADPADYFTFTGLIAGDDFSIIFNRLIDCASCAASFVFTADTLSPVTLGPGQSKTDTGVLAATMLTVGVTDIGGGGVAEGYSVTLSEIPAGVPEPSTAGLFAVGLAGLAVARRKRRR